ncbi:hypothetical protein DMUE_6095 [Dictyocoela muelleri]|nr:hypothetical protein DMUE_6095 [Dictyocoela muelleri]
MVGNLRYKPLHTYKKINLLSKNTKFYDIVVNSKRTNISLLCAINIEGIFAYKIKRGSLKSNFILNFITIELSNLAHSDRKYIVLNNASIHKTGEFKDAFAGKNYIMNFLPPYSPQLNPIEEFFFLLKSRVRQRGINSNITELIESIEQVLSTGDIVMNGYFNHMRLWIERTNAKVDFI